jgi:hypothetical protein
MAEQLALDFTAPKRTAAPPGFRVSSFIPGCIEPTWGSHEGVPMFPRSALAVVLAQAWEVRRG